MKLHEIAMEPETAPRVRQNMHVGIEGHQITPTTVTVVRTKRLSTPYGITQLVNMEDEDGNALVWFNNSSKEMENGGVYTIVGTVKKQDDYKGRNQTNLTRVKNITV
jgi:hypothetical protein